MLYLLRLVELKNNFNYEKYLDWKESEDVTKLVEIKKS